MADYREEINQLQNEHTVPELKDSLEEMLGKRATSVNPLTRLMFEELRPDTQPVEYARKSEGYSEDLSRVATNATALKVLLHEQIGRPLYEPVETLVKQDFAECIAAVNAYSDGSEHGMGIHTPTTLPQEVDGTDEEPPNRSRTPDSPFGRVTDFEPTAGTLNHDITFDTVDSPYFVYVLDCTPVIDDEPGKTWDRRRSVHTKIEAGVSLSQLKPKEQAIHALNEAKRVYYIGSTNDIAKRVREHLSGTDKSGINFTNTLPPQSLVKVQACNSQTYAESLEGALSRHLNRKEGLFAYSDQI